MARVGFEPPELPTRRKQVGRSDHSATAICLWYFIRCEDIFHLGTKLIQLIKEQKQLYDYENLLKRLKDVKNSPVDAIILKWIN